MKDILDEIDEIKAVVESPLGKEMRAKLIKIMDENECTFIEACNILAQEILDEKN